MASLKSPIASSVCRLGIGLALSLLLGACSQDEGESCQVKRDCADGLSCIIARGSERGTCEDPMTATEDDAGTSSGNVDALMDELDAGAAGPNAGDASAPADDVDDMDDMDDIDDTDAGQDADGDANDAGAA